MKFFAGYLREHIKAVLFLLICTAIFAGVFSLYTIPLEAVGYSLFLCFITGAAVTAADFVRERRRNRVLEQLKDNIVFGIDSLPQPKGASEQAYNELVRTLINEKNRLATEYEIKRCDMADYYTMWAHQIKTPIAAMRLLLQSGESDTREIADELFKIEQYVDMVLGYIRLDSDTNDLVIRSCELDDIIRQALRKYSRQFILKKISLDFNETGMKIITDEKWLVFVIGQLLSNSLKYTEKGKISIFAENGVLVLADTGIGISPEDLPRVFEKGYTGYNGRGDRKSTGIGLYLCKRITDRLGHSVRIESDESGTRVYLDLNSTSLGLE